jgi:hypothetical protein
MGFLFKSAVGLGVVYFAMFGQEWRGGELAPQANVCADAAKAGLAGDSGLPGKWAAAGCAVSLAEQAQKLSAPMIAVKPLGTAKPLAAPPSPAPAQKTQIGTLTQADLQEPWFGPVRSPRKGGLRG